MIPINSGILLIADPFLKDPNFMRTVVFLCEHQDNGSIGFILNRLFEQTIDELITDLQDFPIPVYYGGPVQLDTIHYLHQYPDLIPDSHKIYEDIYWGGNFESLIALIKSNEIDYNKIKFFIGYSGWGNEQLEQEFEEKTWLSVNATKKLVFNLKPEDVWKESLKQMGGEYELLSNYPIDPQLN
ncbi:MAG: YqgE/AlgH family protein [Chitinophagaceae bacterium]|nr:YqgE/AlgH family protein [Chitinophagaceae bacterium]